MISGIKKECAIQKCQCGVVNSVDYKDIIYIDKGLAQFRLPVCPGCKTRIEFVFISTDMTQEQFQLMVKMKELGLMEKR